MKKQTKNLIRIFIICIVFHSLKYNIVFAAENTLLKTNAEISSLKITNNVDDEVGGDIKSSTDLNNLSKHISANVNSDSTIASVSVSKVWKIKFDDELDINSIKNNVKVIDKATNKQVDVSIDFQENNKTLSVSCEYSPNKTYTLIIDKNVKSKTNKYLSNTISKDFITDKDIALTTATTAPTVPIAIPTIVSIDDVNVTIQQKEEYRLPSTVNAIMSNGKTVEVKASWDDSLINTGEPGAYVFFGKVSGYEKKVRLNLTIKPIEDSNNGNKEESGGNIDVNELQPRSILHKNLYNYLMNDENRQSVMKRAVELHGGELSNNCVYFASEALRRTGVDDLPESVCNTVQLTGQLEKREWSTSTDFSKLRPGDICFTKSYGSGPTHTFVFMKWVNPGKYDYAYICDNQGNEYDNQIYHKRNVNFATETKDPTVYFMYKP